MRVLSVGSMYPPHHRGGYELVWRGATEHLRARGHDVRVLASDHRESGAADAPDDPGVHRDLRWWWRDDAWPRRSRAEVVAIERHNGDAIAEHLRDFAPDVVAWWAMGGMSMTLLEHVRAAGVPAVGFVHDDWLVYGPVVDQWLRSGRWWRRSHGIPTTYAPGAAAHWAFVSETTRRRATHGAKLALPRTSVVHSGIDHTWIGAGTPPHPWRGRLLCAGRIEPRKGPQVAAAALDHLPDATLTLAGPGETHGLRNQDRLVALGALSRDALRGAYADADAVLFPVIWDEPWGLVPLEAMALGRPVIATGRGGSAEYLRDGENALLVPAGDAAALADAVKRLAGDEGLRARLVAQGKRTAARHTDAIFNVRAEALLRDAARVSEAARA